MSEGKYVFNLYLNTVNEQLLNNNNNNNTQTISNAP